MDVKEDYLNKVSKEACMDFFKEHYPVKLTFLSSKSWLITRRKSKLDLTFNVHEIQIQLSHSVKQCTLWPESRSE